MKSRLTASAKLAPLELDPVRCRATWLDEPELQFAGGRLHCDPKTGIPLYGPRSLGTARHKREVHVGFIGTSEAVEHARQFLVKCSEGVAGDKDHVPFPGCTADQGFRFDLRMDATSVELVTRPIPAKSCASVRREGCVTKRADRSSASIRRGRLFGIAFGLASC